MRHGESWPGRSTTNLFEARRRPYRVSSLRKGTLASRPFTFVSPLGSVQRIVAPDSCRRLANTDPDDLLREHAASSLGTARCASQDRSTSQFLAALAKNGVTPQHVRMAAYWALREVQLGLTEEDLVRRSAALMKILMCILPTGISEEDAKRTALCDGRFADGVWDTAEQIDWNFVDKFLSLEAG